MTFDRRELGGSSRDVVRDVNVDRLQRLHSIRDGSHGLGPFPLEISFVDGLGLLLELLFVHQEEFLVGAAGGRGLVLLASEPGEVFRMPSRTRLL